MKNPIKAPLRHFRGLLLCLFIACKPQSDDPLKGVEIPYVKGEIVVSYKNEEAYKNYFESVKKHIQKQFPKAEVIQCSPCLNLTELWRAEGIEEHIKSLLQSIDGHNIKTATPTGTAGASGDENLAISLNYLIEPPLPGGSGGSVTTIADLDIKSNDNFTVAILDSGLELENYPTQFLWQSSDETSCFPGEKYGWNFTEDGEGHNISDRTNSKHGSLVNYYILEEFANHTLYAPRLLTVKVLDKENKGTLFSLACGVHYAVFRGAAVINASLGFYDNSDYNEFSFQKHPIMHYLHTTFANEGKVLLVTAAGNNPEENSERNLEKNQFYPAVLSDNLNSKFNNVLTVTTSDINGIRVSSEQNFSARHVDVAIRSDMSSGYSFRLPFANQGNEQRTVSGSSFATAILTGKLAGHWSNNYERADISEIPKHEWINEVLPPGNSANQNLSSQVNRGISYIRLNNQ